MSQSAKIYVRDLHPNLLCILCGGYYIDATTITECLHSFCKTCIVRYLETSQFCPSCDVRVHKTQPLLSIRPDKTLQDIVYKTVPRVFQDEIQRRREFYSHQPETSTNEVEFCRWRILPNDPVSVALSPAPVTHRLSLTSEGDQASSSSHGTRYLQCPGAVTIGQLKRLVRCKFSLGSDQPMELLCPNLGPLSDAVSLIDVAYITSWNKMEPLQLCYRMYLRANKRIRLDPERFGPDDLGQEMPQLELVVPCETALQCDFEDDSGPPLLQAADTDRSVRILSVVPSDAVCNDSVVGNMQPLHPVPDIVPVGMTPVLGMLPPVLPSDAPSSLMGSACYTSALGSSAKKKKRREKGNPSCGEVQLKISELGVMSVCKGNKDLMAGLVDPSASDTHNLLFHLEGNETLFENRKESLVSKIVKPPVAVSKSGGPDLVVPSTFHTTENTVQYIGCKLLSKVSGSTTSLNHSVAEAVDKCIIKSTILPMKTTEQKVNKQLRPKSVDEKLAVDKKQLSITELICSRKQTSGNHNHTDHPDDMKRKFERATDQENSEQQTVKCAKEEKDLDDLTQMKTEPTLTSQSTESLNHSLQNIAAKGVKGSFNINATHQVPRDLTGQRIDSMTLMVNTTAVDCQISGESISMSTSNFQTPSALTDKVLADTENKCGKEKEILKKPFSRTGYRTLKAPPKSWNPTLSKEHILNSGRSLFQKGGAESTKTSKFFKARNATTPGIITPAVERLVQTAMVARSESQLSSVFDSPESVVDSSEGLSASPIMGRCTPIEQRLSLGSTEQVRITAAVCAVSKAEISSGNLSQSGVSMPIQVPTTVFKSSEKLIPSDIGKSRPIVVSTSVAGKLVSTSSPSSIITPVPVPPIFITIPPLLESEKMELHGKKKRRIDHNLSKLTGEGSNISQVQGTSLSANDNSNQNRTSEVTSRFSGNTPVVSSFANSIYGSNPSVPSIGALQSSLFPGLGGLGAALMMSQSNAYNSVLTSMQLASYYNNASPLAYHPLFPYLYQMPSNYGSLLSTTPSSSSFLSPLSSILSPHSPLSQSSISLSRMNSDHPISSEPTSFSRLLPLLTQAQPMSNSYHLHGGEKRTPVPSLTPPNLVTSVGTNSRPVTSKTHKTSSKVPKSVVKSIRNSATCSRNISEVQRAISTSKAVVTVSVVPIDSTVSVSVTESSNPVSAAIFGSSVHMNSKPQSPVTTQKLFRTLPNEVTITSMPSSYPTQLSDIVMGKTNVPSRKSTVSIVPLLKIPTPKVRKVSASSSVHPMKTQALPKASKALIGSTDQNTNASLQFITTAQAPKVTSVSSSVAMLDPALKMFVTGLGPSSVQQTKRTSLSDDTIEVLTKDAKDRAQTDLLASHALSISPGDKCPNLLSKGDILLSNSVNADFTQSSNKTLKQLLESPCLPEIITARNFVEATRKTHAGKFNNSAVSEFSCGGELLTTKLICKNNSAVNDLNNGDHANDYFMVQTTNDINLVRGDSVLKSQDMTATLNSYASVTITPAVHADVSLMHNNIVNESALTNNDADCHFKSNENDALDANRPAEFKSETASQKEIKLKDIPIMEFELELSNVQKNKPVVSETKANSTLIAEIITGIESTPDDTKAFESSENVMCMRHRKFIDSTKPVVLINAAKPVESIDASKPADPVASANPVEPVHAPNPVEPVHAPNPVELVDAAESVKFIDPAEPVKFIDPAEPVKSIDAAEPVKSIYAAKPVDPVDAPNPVQSIDAAEPVQSIDAAKPDQSIDAAEPVKSIDAAKPVKSIDAAKPIESIDAAKPVESIDAAEPVESIDAAESVESIDALKPALVELIPDVGSAAVIFSLTEVIPEVKHEIPKQIVITKDVAVSVNVNQKDLVPTELKDATAAVVQISEMMTPCSDDVQSADRTDGNSDMKLTKNEVSLADQEISMNMISVGETFTVNSFESVSLCPEVKKQSITQNTIKIVDSFVGTNGIVPSAAITDIKPHVVSLLPFDNVTNVPQNDNAAAGVHVMTFDAKPDPLLHLSDANSPLCSTSEDINLRLQSEIPAVIETEMVDLESAVHSQAIVSCTNQVVVETAAIAAEEDALPENMKNIRITAHPSTFETNVVKTSAALQLEKQKEPLQMKPSVGMSDIDGSKIGDEVSLLVSAHVELGNVSSQAASDIVFAIPLLGNDICEPATLDDCIFHEKPVTNDNLASEYASFNKIGLGLPFTCSDASDFDICAGASDVPLLSAVEVNTSLLDENSHAIFGSTAIVPIAVLPNCGTISDWISTEIQSEVLSLKEPVNQRHSDEEVACEEQDMTADSDLASFDKIVLPASLIVNTESYFAVDGGVTDTVNLLTPVTAHSALALSCDTMNVKDSVVINPGPVGVGISVHCDSASSSHWKMEGGTVTEVPPQSSASVLSVCDVNHVMEANLCAEKLDSALTADSSIGCEPPPCM